MQLVYASVQSMANSLNNTPKRNLNASGPSATKAGGFQAMQPMNVQPPRLEELQSSYAQIIDAESNPNGWYSNMSRYCSVHLSFVWAHRQGTY